MTPPHAPPPTVSVVVPTFNLRALALECVEALMLQSYTPLEVVVVDDASTDGTAAALQRRYPGVRTIVRDANAGFAAAANTGVRASEGELVALLNNDAVPEPTWIEALVGAIADAPGVGACASRILTPHRRIELAGDRYRPWRRPSHRAAGLSEAAASSDPRPVFGACAAAALYRRAALDDDGLFDEDLQSHYEDVDLSFRLRLARWEVVYVPNAVVVHRGGSSHDRVTVLERVLRNDPLVFLKNMPAVLLCVFLPVLAARQLYQGLYYAARGQARLWMDAKRDAIRLAPTFLRRRAAVQRLRRIGIRELLASFRL